MLVKLVLGPYHEDYSILGFCQKLQVRLVVRGNWYLRHMRSQTLMDIPISLG